MKRFLLATAAVIALAVAAPIATAQYTTPPPATAPYTTPLPDDPATPQDESLSAQEDTTATQSQSTVTTPGAPETTEPMPSTTAQSTTGADTTTHAETHTGADTTTQAQTTTDATTSADAGMGENVATPASLEQHARDAGMDAMPMTAQEVCMPREISLTTSGSRLNRDKQHMLINAADRASVCDIQRVTISSPNGQADQARQLLIDHGVDAGMIEVVDGDAAGLEVDMNFTGIATSSEQYAQMFSTQQFASAATVAPSYAPSTAAPDTSTTPDTTAPDTTAPGQTYDPSMSAPPVESPDPNADPMDDTTDDGMSPTSGEPAVQPDNLDI
jgi:hypothetical protein